MGNVFKYFVYKFKGNKYLKYSGWNGHLGLAKCEFCPSIKDGYMHTIVDFGFFSEG